MKELLNRHITNIYMDEDKGTLVFTDNMRGFWAYEAYGDCCSTSWFESINNPENLIGETVISIEIKPEMRYDGKCADDHLAVYGYTLKTIKGYADIEFRNTSNGYYGGECVYVQGALLVLPDTEGLPLELKFQDRFSGQRTGIKLYPYWQVMNKKERFYSHEEIKQLIDEKEQ